MERDNRSKSTKTDEGITSSDTPDYRPRRQAMTPGWAAWLFPAWIGTVIIAGLASAFIAWQVAFDRGFEEACEPHRHRHRIGSPQETTLLELPRGGAFEPQPEPEWAFFGAQVEPQPGRGEYELLTAPVMTQTTQTMAVTATTTTVGVAAAAAPQETPSAWTRRQGEELARDIDAMIARSEQARQELVGDSNYFQHVIQADGAERRRREAGTS